MNEEEFPETPIPALNKVLEHGHDLEIVKEEPDSEPSELNHDIISSKQIEPSLPPPPVVADKLSRRQTSLHLANTASSAMKQKHIAEEKQKSVPEKTGRVRQTSLHLVETAASRMKKKDLAHPPMVKQKSEIDKKDNHGIIKIEKGVSELEATHAVSTKPAKHSNKKMQTSATNRKRTNSKVSKLILMKRAFKRILNDKLDKVRLEAPSYLGSMLSDSNTKSGRNFSFLSPSLAQISSKRLFSDARPKTVMMNKSDFMARFELIKDKDRISHPGKVRELLMKLQIVSPLEDFAHNDKLAFKLTKDRTSSARVARRISRLATAIINRRPSTEGHFSSDRRQSVKKSVSEKIAFSLPSGLDDEIPPEEVDFHETIRLLQKTPAVPLKHAVSASTEIVRRASIKSKESSNRLDSSKYEEPEKKSLVPRKSIRNGPEGTIKELSQGSSAGSIQTKSSTLTSSTSGKPKLLAHSAHSRKISENVEILARKKSESIEQHINPPSKQDKPLVSAMKKAVPSRTRKTSVIHPASKANPFDEPMPDEQLEVEHNMVACKCCLRTFLESRISKHEIICFKQKKDREVFDNQEMRKKGTDLENFNEPKKRKSILEVEKPDWRKKHEDFVSHLRAAKAVSNHIAKGGKATDLPPMPAVVNDGVPCPHCNRKFNSYSLERHEPICGKITEKNKYKRGSISTKL